MDVLVAGGTGFIGTALCRELAERGHDVTALARSTEGSDLPDDVGTAVGDVTAYDSIEPHVEGRDALVNLVALSPLFKPRGGYGKHEEVHLGGTENCLRAAAEHDVVRFVQMSANGADPDSDIAYIRSKGEAEAAVRESDREWVVFRPSVVFGDGGEFIRFSKLLAPPFLTPLPGGGKTRFQPVWVGDLVPMLADAVEDDERTGEIYEIGGPEVLTLADIARMAHRAEGRPVNVVPIPMGLTRIGLGIVDAVPGVPFGVDQYRSLRLDDTVPANDVDAFGRSEGDLRTLGDYLGLD